MPAKVEPNILIWNLWTTCATMGSYLLADRLRKPTTGSAYKRKERRLAMRSCYQEALRWTNGKWIQGFHSRRNEGQGNGIWKCRDRVRSRRDCWGKHSLVIWEVKFRVDKEETLPLKGKPCCRNLLIFLKQLGRNNGNLRYSVRKMVVKCERIYPLQEKYW